MANPIPILFTIPNFTTAGSGREMLHIVERLDKQRFAPAICVLHKGGTLESTIEQLGIPLIAAPFSISVRPFSTMLLRARRAAQLLAPYHFRIWHSFHWSSDYSEPLIARLAGAQAWVYTKKNMNWGSRAWTLRSLLASRIVARNETMVNSFLANGWFRGKTRLVAGGVDPVQFSPQVPQRLHIRAALGIPADAPLIACVAQLVRVKGQPTLLEAVHRSPGVHALLVGRRVDAAYSEELAAQARQLQIEDRVHFCDFISDIPALLAEADLFVLPTWARWGHEEGCPVALLEAMASGKCCIATAVAGSRDLIAPGENGVLVPPEDAAALGNAIQELHMSVTTRRRLGAAARRTVEEKYTLDHEAAAIQKIYDEILP